MERSCEEIYNYRYYSSCWFQPLDEYLNRVSIDKIPNPAAHDVTQDPFILPKLRDKYLATRLILDDPEDTKLLTQYMATNNVISIR